jgi:hypothetical protein
MKAEFASGMARTRSILILAGVVVAVLVVVQVGKAQSNEGFMYGKITTRSNTYEGQLRWGNEEAFWTDYFNAAKRSSDNYRHIVTAEKKDKSHSQEEFDWDILSIWADKTTTHKFSCQFGDIKKIIIIGRRNARLQFKNGVEVEVNGEGYNDMGGKVQVLDKELGLTAIDWDRIDQVEFLPFPKGITARLGDPLFGTVETERREKFTGYIQWDHDERLTTDKLDGDSRDGNVSIPFANIVSIEKQGRGSLVAVRSGKEMLLKGSNDVDESNRGVIVIVPGKGMVDVPWEGFRKLTLSPAESSGPSYESFTSPKHLLGKVALYDEKVIIGKLVYDIDEALDVETLEGNDNGVKYTIPFRNIRIIRPKNEDYSFIELRNGEVLLLGDGRDVNSNNDGILVFEKGKKDATHIRWRRVERISFD